MNRMSVRERDCTGELKALRQKRRAEDAAASVAEEEKAKKKKAEDEAAAKKKAEEAEAQRKADEEEARRIAEEKEAQLKVDQEAEELQKAMEFADQLQKEAEKAERKAQKAATKAEREPEESDQKAKKVRKAEKAKAKAELAMSKLKAERGAVSNLRWHGNRVGMPRIDFLHDKPEGWKEMWNQRLAAWKARHSEAQKKEDKEKAKGEQPDESGDKKKKSEPERPGHRLEAQRKIPIWLKIHGVVPRFSGTRVGIASANCPERRRARDSSSFAARRDVARPSKMNLHIGSTYGRNATHQAIQVVRL